MNSYGRSLLRRARMLIEHGGYRHVCYAINQAEEEAVERAHPDNKRTFSNAARDLRYYISCSLGEYGTLDGWQRRRGLYMGEDQIKIDRIRWIDWMLGEPRREELKR